jgi:hypothetical protein
MLINWVCLRHFFLSSCLLQEYAQPTSYEKKNTDRREHLMKKLEQQQQIYEKTSQRSS